MGAWLGDHQLCRASSCCGVWGVGQAWVAGKALRSLEQSLLDGCVAG